MALVSLAQISFQSGRWQASESNLKIDTDTGDVHTPGGVLTPIGGIAGYFVNKTGADSKKGTIVHISNVLDRAVDIIDSSGFDGIGFVYQDGVPDGEEMLVVTGGSSAEVLVQDGLAAVRAGWCRPSDTQLGRALVGTSAVPGQTPPDTLTVTVGTIQSGDVTTLAASDGVLLDIKEDNATPGMDVILDFNTEGKPELLEIGVRYKGETSIALQAWNYTTAAWDVLQNIATSASLANVSLGLGADYWDISTGNSRVRFYQADPGVVSRQLYLDNAYMTVTSATHFKEIGHCQESKDAGTDVLVRITPHWN